MGGVVLEAERVGDTAAREGQPPLAGEGRQGLDRSQPVGVIARQHLSGVGRCDRPVGDPARGGLHLDQRLEREEAAAAGAHDLRAGLREGGGHPVGPQGDAGHVGRNEHPGHRDQLSAMASMRAAFRRATGAPSTKALGPTAHSPRQ